MKKRLMIVFVSLLVVAATSSWTLAQEAAADIPYTVESDGTIVAAPAEKAFGLKDDCAIGMILVGPKNDQGWSQAHYEALTNVATAEGCTPIVFESLNSADAPGTTTLDVVTQMVDQGADLIIATSDAFEQDANAVAKAYPDLPILDITGSNRLTAGVADNIANSNSMFEVSRYAAGWAACLKAYDTLGGTMTADTKLNIGFVGPLINNETRRHQSSSYFGARDCATSLGLDPDTQLNFEVIWIGFWFYIPGVSLDPTEVANNFFDRGFQVVISGIDTTEPLQVAAKRHAQGEDVWAIGTDNAKACAVAPEGCIGAQFYDWTKTYTDNVQALKAGTWTADWELRAPDWDNFFTSVPGKTTVGFNIDNLNEEQTASLTAAIAALGADVTANPGTIPPWNREVTLQDGSAYPIESPFSVWMLPMLPMGMVGASSSE